MSGKLSALTSGASDATAFRNPNDTGLLGLSNEILMEIALRVLVSNPSNVNALKRTCWRLRDICRDDHLKKQLSGAIFFSNLLRRNFACRQIDMSDFSGVLPAGEGRLVAYKQCRMCMGQQSTTCRTASCTVTVLDTKKNTRSSPFNVSATSSNLHVVGTDQLLVCSPNNLAIFDLTTGRPISQLPLEEGEREYVAASPCADGRIAYATALKTSQDRLFNSMLAVWSPVTGERIDMPLDLPEMTNVWQIETYGNIVLGYTRQFGSGQQHVKIWDLVTQQVYSSSDTAELARGGLPMCDDEVYCTRPCVVYGHTLVALNFSREKIYVWDYAADADAVAVSTLHIHKDPSLPPIRRRSAQSLTLSPCEKWVIICYDDGELEARSLEQLQNVVALRGGSEETTGTRGHLPSSRLHMFTPCIAVGRRVLFNMAKEACFGIWDPQKPHAPITTVPLGDKMLLAVGREWVDAVMLRNRGDGEQSTVCLPTRNMIFLGGSSILFGRAMGLDAVHYPVPREAVPPLVVWDFDAPFAACDVVVARGPYAERAAELARRPSPVLRRRVTITCPPSSSQQGGPCCIS